MRASPQQHEVMNRINTAGRNAFALLERWDLIEPAADLNGRNGFVVLTAKGRGNNGTDRFRARARERTTAGGNAASAASRQAVRRLRRRPSRRCGVGGVQDGRNRGEHAKSWGPDRKSTRLNSSH